MDELKVNKEELEQLNARKTALENSNLLFQMANREANMFFMMLLKNYGLDEKNNYKIDLKTGIISEVKEEPVKGEKLNDL
jgi:hypothetical protein